jgi:hypothetical protein
MFDIIYSYENEVNKATNSPGVCFTYTPGFFWVCGDEIEIGLDL